MKFLADEGVDKSIVQELRERGYDVFYVIEETRALSDEEVLKIASAGNRILITKDKDFGELIFRLNQAHAGVILMRLEGLTTKERADLVSVLIMKHGNQLLNSFTVIQKDIIRIRSAK